MKYFKFLLFFSLLFFSRSSEAQTGSAGDTTKKVIIDTLGKFHVSQINIIGNFKTKNYIILREMPIKKGDSIPASKLYETLENARNLVYNTVLFSEVTIQPLLLSGHDLILNVILRERWYILPLPQLKIPDSEFVNLPRINFNHAVYGLKFAHYNFSGRGDQLRIYLLNGYARTIAANYRAPYSNRRLTEGFTVGTAYSQSKELPYDTSQFSGFKLYRGDGFQRNAFSVTLAYQMRRGFYWKHLFSFQYNYVTVGDTIVARNPNYFNNGKLHASYPDISYGWQYVNVNNVSYPLKGNIYFMSIFKRGLQLKGGVNMLMIDAGYRKYIDLRRNFYGTIELQGKIKAPFGLAYINQHILGFGEVYLRGLENYVIDGYASMLGRITLSKKIVSFKIPIPFHIRVLPEIPFTFFAKTYADCGFVSNKKQFETLLNNRLLYTGGFGMDILTLYDIHFRVEYSFNQLGENGLFLHTRGGL